MNPIREISLTVRNAVLVTLAVALGFFVGSALGLPVWLQTFFLIPAILLFYGLLGETRPALWKIFGFAGFLSVCGLLFSWGVKHVPEPYSWIFFILFVVFAPAGPILDRLARRFSPDPNRGESGLEK